uniref:Thyroid peroxidase n=1 Tax=Suricata suricatta TaxID=37032 RepID=A0A673VBU9_SURSU
MNGLTSFLDASTVYGSSPASEKQLRNWTSAEGLLRVNARHRDAGRAYLPFARPPGPTGCAPEPGTRGAAQAPCFLAGDGRASEVPTLTAVHTLWLREHNRLAALPTRTCQAHSSPIFLTCSNLRLPTLRPSWMPPWPFLWGVRGRAVWSARGSHARPLPPATQSACADSPSLVPGEPLQARGHTPMCRLLHMSGSQPCLLRAPHTCWVSPPPQSPRLQVTIRGGEAGGADAAAPPPAGYTAWRRFCSLPALETRAHLQAAAANASVAGRMMGLYGHPDNIDVWLGGLAEPFLPQARTGPLFACLIGRQMKALRDGDRFWWESSGVFTEAQRRQLARHSLSRVICDNTGLPRVPPDAFRVGRFPQDFVSCENIPGLNLEAWREVLPQGGKGCEKNARR